VPAVCADVPEVFRDNRTGPSPIDEVRGNQYSRCLGVVGDVGRIRRSILIAMVGVHLCPAASASALVIDVIAERLLETSSQIRSLVAVARVPPVLVIAHGFRDIHHVHEPALEPVTLGPRADYPVADCGALTDHGLAGR